MLRNPVLRSGTSRASVPVPGNPAPSFDVGLEGRRRPSLWRMLIGCLLTVALAAATTVVLIKGEIHTLAGDLHANHAVSVAPGVLAPTGFGETQTMLLVGNDQRAHTTTAPVLPHSNEMLLVRIDPSKPYISMMSIPRELMVTIKCPNGPATTRLNYALTCGGFSTLVSTIHSLTGISVNHVVMIDFNEFQKAVNDIGCVYSTIDRRYYNLNIGTPDTDYSNIDLQPGYQRLCGSQALQFVSYRHGDTSLVRDARDQDFLLDTKKQYGPTLLSNIHKFERVFGETVSVDRSLQSDNGVENLLGTLISAQTLRVRQVQFQVNLEPTGSNPCSCDTATPQQIAASVHSFLHGTDNLPTQQTAAQAHALHGHKGAAGLPLAQVTSEQLAQARATAGKVPFPLEFPRVQDANGFGSGTPVALRDYLIHAPGGTAYPAYVAVFSAGLLGQYYDVQGTTWTGAPIFSDPDQTVAVGGRTYSLYYSGQHLEVVAWFAHGAAYWVHNSLTDAISNGELLAIAEQTTPTGTPGPSGTSTLARGAKGKARLKAAFVPTRAQRTTHTSKLETIGSIGGLITLLAAPLLILALLRRRRRLSALRMHLNTTLALESNLRVTMSGRLREWIEEAGPGTSTNGGDEPPTQPVGVAGGAGDHDPAD
jgi:polyisoprenyl-teichoic acid--peptidoglycan teichoic acid transferase